MWNRHLTTYVNYPEYLLFDITTNILICWFVFMCVSNFLKFSEINR